MNEQTKTYPERETPPRPTYNAIIREWIITGWLSYVPDGLIITVKAQEGGAGIEKQVREAQMSPSDPHARAHAKQVWQEEVIKVLLTV